MNPQYHFIEKILTKEKTIESRWYLTRRSPWKKITKGEVIFFKNSGHEVTIQAKVKFVKMLENLDSNSVKIILDEYHNEIGLEESEVNDFYEKIKTKKYCILIWLSDAKSIQPFKINKKGFGNSTAWISNDNISKLRI